MWGKCKRCHLTTNHFQRNFWCIQFFHNFDLFDNNDPYALNTHKSKMCEQNGSYLVKNSEFEAKNFNKIFQKISSKNSKIYSSKSTSKRFGGRGSWGWTS